MENLEGQLFVICLVLAFVAVVVFVYKVMLSSLGGPDKKERKSKTESKSGDHDLPSDVRPRAAIRRDESAETGERDG